MQTRHILGACHITLGTGSASASDRAHDDDPDSVSPEEAVRRAEDAESAAFDRQRTAETVESVSRSTARLAAADRRLGLVELAARRAADLAAVSADRAAETRARAAEAAERRAADEARRRREAEDEERTAMAERLEAEEAERKRRVRDEEWKKRCETFMRRRSSMFSLNTMQTFTYVDFNVIIFI